MMNYEDIIARKAESISFPGIENPTLNPKLFDHQRDLTTWALKRGRACVFADTGLGKSLVELEYARIVSEKGRVLLLTPLAVGRQIEKEAVRFGVEAKMRRQDQGDRITITNYESIHHFDPNSFVGVVLDESSCLKNYDGKMRKLLTESFARTPFRLACSATPAPNDFTELGTHSQFLGLKTREEMLSEFFVHDGGSTQDWRLKGHATASFWRWVASWGAIVKMPSDLGYDDSRFVLPPLEMVEHIVDLDHSPQSTGLLFPVDAATLSDQRQARRDSLDLRVQKIAELAQGKEPIVVWCELNDEAKACVKAIDGSVEVEGSDDPDKKAVLLSQFAEGKFRVLVTKPKIAGFGLNWQHCATQIFAGASHSYEQTYQAIRRSWRFGQTRPVTIHIVRSNLDGAVIANYRRKDEDAKRMALEMTKYTSEVVRAEVRGLTREFNEYNPKVQMRLPKFLEVSL